MRKLLFIACGILGICGFGSEGSAQNLTRVCIGTYDSQGVLHCQDNGWQPLFLSSLSNTVTSIKSSNAGQLGQLYCYNPNGSAAYVQLFDVATTAGVTLGTTTPTLSFGLPASSYTEIVHVSTLGIHFANGLQIAATTTATGSTAPGTPLTCDAGYN